MNKFNPDNNESYFIILSALKQHIKTKTQTKKCKVYNTNPS